MNFVFLLRQVHFRKEIQFEDDVKLTDETEATGLTYLWKRGLRAACLLDGLLVAGRVFRLGDWAPK